MNVMVMSDIDDPFVPCPPAEVLVRVSDEKVRALTLTNAVAIVLSCCRAVVLWCYRAVAP